MSLRGVAPWRHNLRVADVYIFLGCFPVTGRLLTCTATNAVRRKCRCARNDMEKRESLAMRRKALLVYFVIYLFFLIIFFELYQVIVGIQSQEVEAVQVFGEGQVIERFLQEGDLIFLFCLVQ